MHSRLRMYNKQHHKACTKCINADAFCALHMQACFEELSAEITLLQLRDETLALARLLKLPCRDVLKLCSPCSQEMNTNKQHKPPVQLMEKHWLRRQLMYVSGRKLCSCLPKIKPAPSQKQLYVRRHGEVVRSLTH